MEFIVYGAIGAIIVLGSFLMGAVFMAKQQDNRKPQDGASAPPAPPAVDEAEKQRFMEDQRAFESLLQYNTDVVYGRTENMGGGGS